MENWIEKVHEISTYNPECKDAMDFNYNTNLSENVSPLTKFFLNTFVNTMDKKNIIVTFPDNILRPLPIIAYSYSFLNKKSTLVFTSNTRGLEKKSPREIHNLDYYMLNWEGDYLFYDIPIGYLFKDKVEAKVQMPLATKKFKKTHIEHLKRNFIETDGPKILLYADNGTKIIENVNSILLDNNAKFKKHLNFDLGCVVFENMDRYVNSKYTTKQFVNWIKNYMNDDINFVFHFSNPNSPFINYISEKTNSFVIPFTHGILTNNHGIIQPSMDYFSKIKVGEEVVEKYNLDRPYFYNDDSDISILEPLIEAGNIDHYFLEAKNLLKRIDEGSIYNKKIYYRSLGLLYSLQDLIINPAKYKIRYGDYEIDWRFFSIPEFLGMFTNKLNKENSLNQLILEEYISQLENIYSEISRCKRFGEENSYNRIGKDYKIIDVILNKESYFSKDTQLIIGAYSNSESSVLKQKLEDLNISDIEIRHIGWLNKSNFDRSEYSLLLPGPLPVRHFSELLRSYKKIIVLAYDGYNFNRISDQIKLVNDYSISEEIISMNYFKQIYDYLGVPQTDSLFNDYKERIDKLEIEKDPIIDDKPLDSFDKIKNLIKIESTEYKEDLDNLGRMITNIKEEKNKEIKKPISSESIEFSLLNLENGLKYVKLLPVEKTYFFLKNIGAKVEECSPKDLKPGNFVIILENDEKKTLLQLIIEMYDLESNIDREIIEFWKERLMLFMKDTGIKYRELYNVYSQFGGQKHYQTVLNWAKGKVIGPEDPKDLHFIGKILGENILKDNYWLISEEIEKVRNIHRITGRRLKNVIKAIIFEGNSLDAQNLNYEEYLIYEKVKNGIYEIQEIR